MQAQRINRYLLLDLAAFVSVAAATQAFRPEWLLLNLFSQKNKTYEPRHMISNNVVF